MSQDKAIVEIRGLTKQFKKKMAVEAVDWELLPNRIIGLLGANGAGKSTLNLCLSRPAMEDLDLSNWHDTCSDWLDIAASQTLCLVGDHVRSCSSLDDCAFDARALAHGPKRSGFRFQCGGRSFILWHPVGLHPLVLFQMRLGSLLV